MKKFILVCMLIFLLCGCNQLSNDSDIKKLMSENDYVIVDVRTQEEYEEEHLVGAINISYDELDENSDLDKEKVIFVYCKSGNRSK